MHPSPKGREIIPNPGNSQKLSAKYWVHAWQMNNANAIRSISHSPSRCHRDQQFFMEITNVIFIGKKCLPFA